MSPRHEYTCEDAHYLKPPKRTIRTPEESHMDRLIEGLPDGNGTVFSTTLYKSARNCAISAFVRRFLSLGL